ncbi:MBL fold metallo-hydrolase [Methanohalophilus profundi]|uniref:MBL fold metallo-hydrolase n=1 Tax=Methanohalophilus profundi TaxID=2138083 RepID=UPI00101BB922|nr:MBL fold metallo-hydrolase [Methanohalophilus profundi]
MMNVVGKLEFRLVSFDSMGAKSSCIFVKTPDTSILIDPGAAILQKSFPLSDSQKQFYLLSAIHKIKEEMKEAEHIIISHYHFDHYMVDEDSCKTYLNSNMWIKDPNRWINHSQWERSRKFLQSLSRLKGTTLKYSPPMQCHYKDPVECLPLAFSMDFGDYQQRREELISRWRKRFLKMQKRWSSEKWVVPVSTGIYFSDGCEFKTGNTKVRFSRPLFHGIEYSATGWVIATIIEYGGKKLLHTSDLQGPVIEDHAQWIIDENPDILILDGPPTYLLGYLLNRTNLDRSINNIIRIIKESVPNLIIYDHHLLRDPLYRERTEKVWDIAVEMDVSIMTAAEYKGLVPVVLK